MAPKRRVIDDSDSDEEGGDVDEQLQSMFSQSSKPSSRKRTKQAESSDDSDSSDDSEFDDGYDANLIGDEKDRNYLDDLTDLKRSEILFKRQEERDRKREIWNLKRSLKATKKGTTVKNDKRRSSSQGTQQQKKSAALSQLRASRTQKKQDASRRQQKKRHEFRSSESESSSSSEDDKDDSEDEYIPSRTKDRSKSKKGQDSSDDSDDVNESKKYDEPARKTGHLPASHEIIEKIRISRNRLERWIEEPYLETAVTGCFVRVLIGNNAGRPIYRLCEIVRVTEYNRTYQLGQHSTRLALELKHAKDTRVFRIEYVSNSPSSQSEYNKWREAMEKADLAVVTEKMAKKRIEELVEAKNFVYTEEQNADLIAKKIQQRKEALEDMEQFQASDKNELVKDLKKARILENHDEVERLEGLLAKVEASRERERKSKFERQDFVKRINERNRKRNEELQAVALENKAKTVSRNVDENNESEGEAGTPKKAEAPSSTVLPSASDLFAAHDFDLDIDVTPAVPNGGGRSMAMPPRASTTAVTDVKRTNVVSIERYKEQHGLL